MIRSRLFLVVSLISFLLPLAASARDIAPFVSSEWLEQNLSAPDLMIVDVRSAAAFAKGHIPGAVHAPSELWAENRGSLMLELPPAASLSARMQSLGIRKSAKIVVVGAGATDFARADAVRAAWTIIYAGVKNVAVLDGGFSKWDKEKRAETREKVSITPSNYQAVLHTSALASKQYVLGRIGKSLLLDTRAPDIYFGANTEPWAPTPGHIQGAVNLPSPWIFTQEGLVRTQKELERMAQGVLGANKSREVIVYCGVGGYAAAWSYVLSELLGYPNVKVYDGSMQEWILDPSGPVTLYRWR